MQELSPYEQAKAWTENGRAAEAIPLLQKLLTESKDEHQLKIRWWLGRAHYEMDDMDQALAIFEPLLLESEAFWGSEAEFCFGVRRWLADTLHLLDDFERAQVYYERVYPDYLTRYGSSHDYFLCLMHWMAKNLHALGEFERAQELFERAWVDFPAVYGAQAQFSLEHRSWWAANLGALGRLSEEAEMEWELLRVRMDQNQGGEALLWAFANLRDTLESMGDEEGLRHWEICRVESGLPRESFE